jgi:uncharacterized OB-fold protein
MATVACSKCGHEVSVSADVCPSCGVVTALAKRRRSGRRHLVSGVLIVLLAMGGYVGGRFEKGLASAAVLALVGFAEGSYGLRKMAPVRP